MKFIFLSFYLLCFFFHLKMIGVIFLFVFVVACVGMVGALSDDDHDYSFTY